MPFAIGTDGPFVPALIVVDMQEDFCPPNGSLAVQEGRDIAPLINHLLSESGFVTRIATQDYHPSDHISFASNHPPPNNQPFESCIEMQNPAPGKQAETKLQQLWPVHCVADSPGAMLIPEIRTDLIDVVVQKGKHSQVEMYSAFADAFGNSDPATVEKSVNTDIAELLRAHKVTDVFVVGLAGDYCVKCTAIDAAKAGFRSWLIEEATKCVSPTSWGKVKEEVQAAGVSVIHGDDPMIQKLAVR